MLAYVVERKNVLHRWSKRIGPLHQTVFFGTADYRSLLEWVPQSGFTEEGEPCVISRPPDWRWPAVTNANREPLHISRSGRFVPSIWGRTFTNFVVSPKVQQELSSLPHVKFNQVVFELLVNLPMPKLGDFSWLQRDDLEKYDFHPDKLLLSMPHVAKFEHSVEEYRQLLPANFDDIADEYDDIAVVQLNFGSYAHITGIEEIRVSKQMLAEYPIIQSPHFLFREDAFALIAPFLNLDYYAVAVLNLGR